MEYYSSNQNRIQNMENASNNLVQIIESVKDRNFVQLEYNNGVPRLKMYSRHLHEFVP